jgi:Uma2 family endonuclease
MSTVATEKPVRRYTARQLEGLYEIVDGRIVEKTDVGARELLAANDLADFLKAIPAVAALGRILVEMIFDLRPRVDRHRRPDVAFVSYRRWPKKKPVPDGLSWPVIPDLAVEIISKTNSALAVKQKLREYFEAGVRRVWVVYPETREIEDYAGPTSVTIVEARGTLDASALWPGVKLKVGRLFSNL